MAQEREVPSEERSAFASVGRNRNGKKEGGKRKWNAPRESCFGKQREGSNDRELRARREGSRRRVSTCSKRCTFARTQLISPSKKTVHTLSEESSTPNEEGVMYGC